MKISNELKVGALTAVAIVILILGFNFLKGTDLTKRSEKLYAVFPNVKGLAVSNAVIINGLPVGKVSNMAETDPNMSGIIVEINLDKHINIPENSQVTINSELLGSGSLEILMGNSGTLAASGDTLESVVKAGLMDNLSENIRPTMDNVNSTLTELQVLIKKTSAIMDDGTDKNLRSIIANLQHSTASLDRLISSQNGVLMKSLNNVESITGNLASNNEKISNTLGNLEATSAKFAAADIEQVLQSVSGTMQKLEATVEKISSTDGSLGMLLNDRQLYKEIRETNRSLTTLLDDVRVNPKRYVSISVFGRKDKGPMLQAPIYDTTQSSQ